VARLTLLVAALPVIAGPNGYLRPPITPTHFDHQRLLVMASLLAVILLLAVIPAVRRPVGAAVTRIPSWAWLALGLFFSLGLLSAALSPSRGAAFLEWGNFLLALVAVLAVAGARRSLGGEGDYWLLAPIVAGVTLYVGNFLAIYIPTIPVPWATIFWSSPFYHFNNVRFLNQFQSWTLPLLAAAVLLAGPRSRALQGLLALVGGFWWALLFATGGRGALIAALLSSLLVLLVFRERARRWAGATLVLVGLGGILYILLFYLPGNIPGLERAVDRSGSLDHARLQLWADALKVALAHPLLGVGPMQLAHHPVIASHPHDLLLQILAEWGLPAGLAAVALVFGGVLAWSRRWQGWEASLGSGPPGWTEAVPPALTASLLAGLGHGMVSGVAVMPMSQAMAVLVVGWIMGVHQGTWKEPDSLGTPRGGYGRGWPLAALGLCGAVAVTPGLTSSLPHLRQATESYKRQQQGKRFHPRFWLQGDLCLPPWAAPADGRACTTDKQAEADR